MNSIHVEFYCKCFYDNFHEDLGIFSDTHGLWKSAHRNCSQHSNGLIKFIFNS